MNESGKSLDPELWHACAGGMVQMPSLNSKVFYFPQGHAEHSQSPVDFSSSLKIPALIPCRVLSIKFLADPETDEVFAKLKLLPLPKTDLNFDPAHHDEAPLSGPQNPEKPTNFSKTLTQSDANNGGGFSVPRYCAETIFPRLDYGADPPVQTVTAKDVHGEVWKFRHIYRGTPRRHLLTTGWSSFVNQKKLIAGDSIVFFRAENGELRIGIRRTKRGVIGGALEGPTGWNPSGGGGGFSMYLRDDESSKMMMRNGSHVNLMSRGKGGGGGRVRAEAVIEAGVLASSGQAFEVVYYPRAGTPEFCVKAGSVMTAMRTQWCSGMRFKMAFETEDSSRISWFMGTIASVQVADPIYWPNSPWRLLQVTWDEPDLLQNVKRVSPWLVEVVSNMPVIHLTSPFSPPRKKLRIPGQHPDFSFADSPYPMPSFLNDIPRFGPSSSPLCCLSDNNNSPIVGIQGARHTQFPQPKTFSPSELYLNNSNNKMQLGLFPSSGFYRMSNNTFTPKTRPNSDNNLSCLLTIGNASLEKITEKPDNVKEHGFVLFGQPILTEEQMSRSSSGKSSSDLNSEGVIKPFLSDGSAGSTLKQRISPDKSPSIGFLWYHHQKTELGLMDTGHCKVFLESEDVGQNIDLSGFDSYEELYRKLTKMFGIERSDMIGRVLYQDATGAIKHIGDEPFGDFMNVAKKLTILTGAGRDRILRTWIPGMGGAENGLNASNKSYKTGPALSIFA